MFSKLIYLLQDNCAVHKSADVGHWFKEHKKIELLKKWPSNSPDLNLMEIVFAAITPNLADVFPRSRENLQNAIVTNWEKCRGNNVYFENLYEVMPRRLFEVINNGGGPTNY